MDSLQTILPRALVELLRPGPLSQGKLEVAWRAAVGDGLSQPSAMAAGLSIYPRLAGTASGLMGFTQMIVASLGTYLVALLPYDSAFGTVIVVGGFIAPGLGFVIFAVCQPGSGSLPMLGAMVPPHPDPAPIEGG